MISEKEKDCYNLHLSISRSSRNLPYTIKKNFDGFENTPEYVYIRKLMYFFTQFPQIKQDIYFKAPYILFKDENWFDLKFYTSQKAIKLYTIYFKMLNDQSPDTTENIQFIKESLVFIGHFCLEHNIHLADYSTFSMGATKSWMKHIREHKISIYVMFWYNNIMAIITDTPKDELDLFLGSMLDNIYTYNNRYSTSKAARTLIVKGMSKINSYIEKNLKQEVTKNDSNLNQENKGKIIDNTIDKQ